MAPVLRIYHNPNAIDRHQIIYEKSLFSDNQVTVP
jgi:hypothetical protein